MIYVSFASKNSPYVQVVKKYLISSLKKWGLSYDIDFMDDRGSWEANIQYKPIFIKKMLLKHKQSIVALDADATIEHYPKLFGKLKDYDMAYHELDWYKFWKNQEGNPKREILGGTVYFNYNEKVLEFVEEWIIEQKKNKGWAQRNMQKVLERWKDKLKIYILSIEYCAIVKGGDKVPNFIKNPVVIHHQISRKYRRYRRKK